jgi:hypothetical protein
MKQLMVMMMEKMMGITEKVYDVTAWANHCAVVTVKAKNKREALRKVRDGEYEDSDIEMGEWDGQFITAGTKTVEEVR